MVLEGAEKVLAEVELLDHELDKLDDKAKAAGPGGLLGRILNGAEGAGGGASSGAGALPLIGGMPLPALLAIVPALGAALVEVTGLVSGFAAAGAGAGSFALLAAPSVKKVETAYTALSAAQAKYQAAQAKEAADPTKSNAKALQAAALNLQLAKEAISKMPASEQGAITGIHSLASEFGKMAAAFAPDVFKVFNDGLKIANQLLPAALPFARTFADVLDGLLKKVGAFAGSKGFADWLKQFHSIEGPAIAAIGDGIGKVAIAIGKLLTTMSGKDVARAISIAFGAIAGTINALAGTVKFLMQVWDGAVIAFTGGSHTITSKFDAVRHFIAGAGHDIAGDFDRLRHAAADLAHNVASHFDEIRATIARWAADVGREVTRVVAWFRALPGRILSALGNLGSLLVSAGVHLVEGLIRGIESKRGDLAAAAQNLIKSLGSKIEHLLGIGSPSKLAHWWGQMVAQGMADGIAEHARLPADAAAKMAASVSSGLGSRGGSPGRLAGGGNMTLTLRVDNSSGSGLDQMFMTWLKNRVRVDGGDAAMFNKKVQFL